MGEAVTASPTYLVVIERGERNYSAYVPDLPGCIVTGGTREQVVERMRAAIALHVEGLRADGDPVPEPVTSAELVAA
jgi:predicted RNase H-like HicB family nuclease